LAVLWSYYIKEMLEDLQSDTDGEAATPTVNHLFQVVSEEPKKLDENIAQNFHHNIVKLLFLSMLVRPSTQKAVVFLTTRVNLPGTDDYMKLARTMRHLWGLLELPLTLEADNMHIVKWWVNGARGCMRT
jgi:hypothetical protein